MQIGRMFNYILGRARDLFRFGGQSVSKENKQTVSVEPATVNQASVAEEPALPETLYRGSVMPLVVTALLKRDLAVPSEVVLGDGVKAGPSLKKVDLSNKSFKQIAASVVEVLGERLLEIVGDKSLSRYHRAVEFLFRLESSPEEHFDKIAKGDGYLPASKRAEYYTGSELLDNLPAKELEELFIYVTHEPELALELARFITGREDYKATPTIVTKTDKRHSSNGKASKIVVQSGQLAQIANFAAVTSSRTYDVDHFLGIHRNGLVSTSLKADEFEKRLAFLNILLEHKPQYTSVAGLNLIDEYHGYESYNSQQFANYRRTIDTFLDSFDDYKINNFSNKTKLAYFLEKRKEEGDLSRAIEFFHSLTKLKNIYGVEGTYDLLELAVANREKHPDQEDFTYGFYEQANAAYLLADANKPNLKVIGIAREEINNGDNVIQVPRAVGDIDILALENGRPVFIEVKATACAAENHEEQINSLVGFARSKNAKAVLIVGNIRDLIKKVEHYSPLHEGSYGEATTRAVNKINFLADLIAKHDGDLVLWNKVGKDITATVTTVAGKVNSRQACLKA